MNKKFAVYEKKTGAVICSGYGNHEAIEKYRSNGTEVYYLSNDFDTEGTLYFDQATKTIEKAIQKPSNNHVFNYSAHKWELDIKRLAQSAREQRNALLATCDWTQLADVPNTSRGAWTRYRQALRDLTDQPGFPENITWPTPPT